MQRGVRGALDHPVGSVRGVGCGGVGMGGVWREVRCVMVWSTVRMAVMRVDSPMMAVTATLTCLALATAGVGRCTPAVLAWGRCARLWSWLGWPTVVVIQLSAGDVHRRGGGVMIG